MATSGKGKGIETNMEYGATLCRSCRGGKTVFKIYVEYVKKLRIQVEPRNLHVKWGRGIKRYSG